MKDNKAPEKFLDEVFNSEEKARIKELFCPREWNDSGKCWSFLCKNYEKKGKDYSGGYIISDLIVERTEEAMAMLDCRYGNLYYWDDRLCTFGLINMENFLIQEKFMTENPDKHCERLCLGVRIYYKGIELEKRELPGIGNELFQYIDIKGKLERKYINLSRKGLTDEGERYFIKKIYTPFLESISKMLKEMNKNQPNEIVNGVKQSLEFKAEVYKILNAKINQYHEMDDSEILWKLNEMKKQLIRMYKESVISFTMLSFLAQKTKFDPVMQIGCIGNGSKQCCWSQVIEVITGFCGNSRLMAGSCIFEEKDNSETSEKVALFKDVLMDNSVLFHTEYRYPTNLSTGELLGDGTSDTLTFPEIFSNRNQFMIVSKREDRFAPWKQYLVPIWSDEIGDSEENNLIYLLKRYLVMSNYSRDKEEVQEKILQMGNRALRVAETAIESFGGGGNMTSKEYQQQYFLKWLLCYIPTVALFMSEDGNVRVNIIHSMIFPSIFVNDWVKRLTIQRIFEEADKYGIQRFSIPAWQGMEYISCQELPYSHYFVKRGYLCEESCNRVIFPFVKEEIQEMWKQINSSRTQKIVENLKQLCVGMLMRNYLPKWIEKIEGKNYIEALVLKVSEKDTVRTVRKEFINSSERIKQRTFPRLIDRAKILNRNLVISELKTKNIEKSSLEELIGMSEKWENVYVMLLTQALCNDYGVELPKEVWENLEGLESYIQAWDFILHKKYLESTRNVKEYQEKYKEQIVNADGTVYDKRERILTYIEKFQGNRYTREYLENCWNQYTDELFCLFRTIEEEQYLVFQMLDDDCRAINRGLSEGN